MCEIYGKNRWLYAEIEKATKQNDRDKAGLLQQYRIRKYKFGRAKMADKRKFKAGDKVRKCTEDLYGSHGFWDGHHAPSLLLGRGELTVLARGLDTLKDGGVLMDLAVTDGKTGFWFVSSKQVELVTPPAPEKMVTVESEDGTKRDWSMSTVREALRKHAE